MLLVKTKVDKSNIDGIGLFADEFIPEGTVTWRFDPKFDIRFNPSHIEKMSKLQKDLIIRFAYLSKKSGMYVYSIDDARFTNHSINPNTMENKILYENDVENCTVATRDIQKGEEITIDYRTIDANDEISSDKYLMI